ncbi:glutamine amidotransferase [Patulibacter sp. NPDC049589]|uniref:glutamine amidotransferase n=1 Tax=Patulibacter sp. NPDC049589 TaxID=3154731 RepID=UPI003440C93E
MPPSHPSLNVLVVGESWVKHTVHMKGFDQFHSTEYEEGGGVFLAALADAGHAVTYVRAHEITTRFPTDAEDLGRYDVVVISDVGANSFLLTDDVFLRSEPSVNRLRLLVDYVSGGGGLLMIGGYLSFAGIDGRARYGASPLADVLPVRMLDHDDRVEIPEGASPCVVASDHGAIAGTHGEWPILLGYNRLVAKGDASVIVQVGEDPLITVGEFGLGRSVAFASDCAPHWAPPAFVSWSQYPQLWASIVRWAAGGRGAAAGTEGAAGEPAAAR